MSFRSDRVAAAPVPDHAGQHIVQMCDGAAGHRRLGGMDEPEPAVLARQPYDKNNSCLGDTSWSSRTCGGSSGRTAGHWRRTGEVDDTYGTMEWITKQSWSNGAVGMFGDSSSHLAHYWIDNNVYVGHR